MILLGLSFTQVNKYQGDKEQELSITFITQGLFLLPIKSALFEMVKVKKALAIRHVASKHFATICSILGDKGLLIAISLKTAIGRLPSVLFRKPKILKIRQYRQKRSPSP